MVKRISTYKIKEFPEDDRIWRLAWLGKLNINPNVLTEPTIDAILVPFKSNIIDNQVDVTSNASYDYTKIRVICIGTGLFPILRLGSFWVNGVEVPGNSTYKEKIVSNLVISSKTSIISDFNINKGQQDAQTGLNIFSHYPEVSRFPLSKILVIDWHEKNNPDPNTKLLIPCTEIFRFYYGRSSQLARILLHGGLETESNRIYDPVLSKCFNGMGYLKLRQSIPDLNADVVARLAFSEYANKQATNIYHNLLKHKENTNNFILEVRPPFEAEINLSVLGKWVKSFGTWHFLAIRLITCSSPFPFQHLTFDRDNDGRTVENNEDKPVAWTTSHRHFVKKKLLKKNDNIVTNEAEPWVNLELTELNIDEVDCFTSLQGIIIEKSTKTENQSQSSKTTTFIPHESGNEYSTGEGSNSRSLFEPLAVIVQSKHIGKNWL